MGKTTSALNLAYALSRGDHRVLLVDMDPQATATVALLADGAVEAYRQRRTMAQVILGDVPIAEVIIKAGEEIIPDRAPLCDLAASHIDLAETDGRREPGFDITLREALEQVRDRYDFIVIDAPPNLGMLTWMSLAAADDGYHGHYHLTDKETLMAQSRAENLAAKAAGIDIRLVQGDGGLKEKARVTAHADDC